MSSVIALHIVDSSIFHCPRSNSAPRSAYQLPRRKIPVTQSFSLIDVDHGVHDTTTVIAADTVPSAPADAEWSIRMVRLHGGLSDGVDVIELNNGCLKLSLLPTRGMGLWKGSVAGTPLAWNSPVERPVNPAYVDEMRRGGIGWLDGFNEMLVRCGLGWNGAPGNEIITDADGNTVSEQFLPLHGRIANLPAHKVTVAVSEEGQITITGLVDEASMFGGKLRLTATLTTWIGSNTFEIHDNVANIGGSPADIEMLYHCNFGAPLLEQGATFQIAATEIAPRDARAAEDCDTWTQYLGPTPGYAEQCYFVAPIADDDNRGLALLATADQSTGVALRFDTSTLPFFTLWKNTQAAADGYCTGLEPATGFPNLRSFERDHGRVTSLAPGEDITFQFALTGCTSSDDIAAISAEITALQGDTPAVVHTAPRPDWSA